MAVEYRSFGGSRESGGNADKPGRAQGGVRVVLDDTLPPTPIGDLFAANANTLNVYVLAADPAVQEAVERACGDRYPLTTAEGWSALLEAIDARRCDIAFIEAAVLGDRLSKCVTELEPYAAHVVTLVAADRSESHDLISLLSERKIHRLLIKPPAPGITRLLLESAVSRCMQLRAGAASQPLVPVEGALKRTRMRVRLPTWVLATGVSALVLGVALTLGASSLRSLWSSPTGRATGAAAPAAVPAPAQADRFADLIARAERAFSEGRLADPPGDNALDYYLVILAADPTHEKARDRLPLVVDALFTQAENALLAGSLDTAATALANVRRAAPTSGRLAFLDAQLVRARADAANTAAGPGGPRTTSATDAEDRASPASTLTPAQRAELEQSLAAGIARLRRGELIEPTGDSALDNLQRATKISATDPRVTRARTELGAAVVSSARAVLDAGDVDSGVRLIGAAQTLGVADETLVLLRQKVTASRAAHAAEARTGRVAAARARIEAGALTTPADDNALSILSAVEKEAPETPGLADAWGALVSALAGKARTAIADRDWAAAEAGISAVGSTGHAGAVVGTLTREFATARLQQEYLATTVPASELGLLSYAVPLYPAELLQRQVEGWVDLEFVVDRTGQTRDIVVVKGNPTGRFDQAAVAAVAKYRYQPFVRDGQAYERRVRLRLRFNLR